MRGRLLNECWRVRGNQRCQLLENGSENKKMKRGNMLKLRNVDIIHARIIIHTCVYKYINTRLQLYDEFEITTK